MNLFQIIKTYALHTPLALLPNIADGYFFDHSMPQDSIFYDHQAQVKGLVVNSVFFDYCLDWKNKYFRPKETYHAITPSLTHILTRLIYMMLPVSNVIITCLL